MKKLLFGALISAVIALVACLVPYASAVRRASGHGRSGKLVWERYTSLWCLSCHGVNGEGAFGPDLAGRDWRFENFAHAVRKPWGIMPAYTERQVTDQNIADLVAYVNSLPAVAEPGPWRTQVPADAPPGLRLLIETVGCAQCHGGVLNNARRAAGGVGADFEWFEEEVYEHTAGTPTGRMGNFSRARLPEAVLRRSALRQR
jgi:mono/diheme cytochrome c family protein